MMESLKAASNLLPPRSGFPKVSLGRVSRLSSCSSLIWLHNNPMEWPPELSVYLALFLLLCLCRRQGVRGLLVPSVTSSSEDT
ncbi:hypothetical protein E2C01_088042 [Portunus trituberculatus]|uniref:Uncharacterized protein n=1 Tax=Portunus trituberculatus TaxID=210409 RepID=A0A5B7JDF5_PORTR|nr:hypothetical protein [Portunus trituberculatus]